jgi:hypothetical protein
MKLPIVVIEPFYIAPILDAIAHHHRDTTEFNWSIKFLTQELA